MGGTVRRGTCRMSVPLTDNSGASIISAWVIEPLTATQIEDTENVWLPYLLSAWQARLQSGTSASDLPEHKHWLWTRKARQYLNKSGYRFFGLVAGGETQGLMLINTIYQCRLPVQRGQPLVFVDYIATAPWNLRTLTDTPKYRGVGKALVEAAMRFSLASAMAGRIGLHALPLAEPFYRDTCGMSDLGADPNEYDLCYFETTEAQTDAFLQAR